MLVRDIIRRQNACTPKVSHAGTLKMLFLFLPFFAFTSSCKGDLFAASGDDNRSASRIQAPTASPAQVTPPSKDKIELSNSAEYIKRRIEKYKEWGGGHSPIPSRVVNMNTVRSVSKEIAPEDSPALMILLQDDADDIRSVATSLLGCIDPNAQSEIEKLLATEKDIERQYRFKEALIGLDSIRAGRTSCK